MPRPASSYAFSLTPSPHFTHRPPLHRAAELETQIRRKYVTRDFVDPEACWPPAEEFEDEHIRWGRREGAGAGRAGRDLF